MGNTCKSTADSCPCMTKTTTIFKVISLQLIKINEKKKKDMWVQSVSREHPMEEEMATHTSMLPGKISWTEKSGGLYIVHKVTKSQTR